MQSVQVVLPRQLPFLLRLDPKCIDFIHFLLLFRHVVFSLLLKFRQLHRDLVPLARPYIRLIQHFDGHVYRLQHCKPYPRVSFRLPCLLVPVYLDLLLPSDGIEPKYPAPYKIVSELVFCDVGGETLDVDVVVDFGLEPLSFFVFLVALLF